MLRSEEVASIGNVAWMRWLRGTATPRASDVAKRSLRRPVRVLRAATVCLPGRKGGLRACQDWKGGGGGCAPGRMATPAASRSSIRSTASTPLAPHAFARIQKNIPARDVTNVIERRRALLLVVGLRDRARSFAMKKRSAGAEQEA
eukprot:6212882-Pleurochrysis_carterae.AAC.1